MSTKLNYSRSRTNPTALLANALLLGTLFFASACASSGGSAGGTYHATPTMGSGASWPGEPGGVHINVSLAERKLYLKNGATIVSAYPISIGQPSYPTPQGNFSVRRIVWNPSWTPPDAAWAADKEPADPGMSNNPMKVVKIYFDEPDYYIHGTGDPESLGGAESHGCLRLSPQDAAALGKYLMQNGGAARDAAWFETVRKSNETETVVLGTGIPMHIAN